MMDAVMIRVCSVVNTDVAEVPPRKVNYFRPGPETILLVPSAHMKPHREVEYENHVGKKQTEKQE